MSDELDDKHSRFSRGVPLSLAIPVLFFLLSSIGALTTWFVAWTMSANRERAAIVAMVRADVDLALNAWKTVADERFDNLKRRVEELEDELRQLSGRNGRTK